MKISSVLCVCTGNICRSPLAERLLARALPDLTVASAGIGALQGRPMAPGAAAIAQRQALTPEAHAARQLTADMIRESDLVLVMESTHKAWIEKQYPQSRGRVFMISHWQGGDDIEDPYGLPDDVFEAVYAELVACAADWCTRLSA